MVMTATANQPEYSDCGSRPNRDPSHAELKPLIFFMRLRKAGVPFRADRDLGYGPIIVLSQEASDNLARSRFGADPHIDELEEAVFDAWHDGQVANLVDDKQRGTVNRRQSRTSSGFG